MTSTEMLRMIRAQAPIRFCDNGGWTDTWFAEHGRVFNIAVSPYAQVQIKVYPAGALAAPVILDVQNYGDRYPYDPAAGQWARHPLLEAAITRLGIPADVNCEISLFSEAPGGGSTGTSAAVTVALLGALDCLTPGRLSPAEIARHGHAVETEMLGQQSGIQDQLASAYGGINYIQMTKFPQAEVQQLTISDDLWLELEQRLLLIFLGHSHSSTKVHEQVIAELANLGPENVQLEDLRQAADQARDSLLAGDLTALGQAMIANVEAQARLHPELVSVDAYAIIALAQQHGAQGWKVNGAGGDGGSLTLLAGPDIGQKRALLMALGNAGYQHIPTRLSRVGLQTWDVGLD